jgi:DNA-binding transcriptional regulator YhcF (GntR family)
MAKEFTEEKPIFIQIAEKLEDAVLSGAFPEEGRLPSTTEIAAAYRINPATALKGVTLLVKEGAACKKRGLGMFVCSGAVEIIRAKRRRAFYENYVVPLAAEAEKLGVGRRELETMLERGLKHET